MNARKTVSKAGTLVAAVEACFAEVVALIEQARLRAHPAINTELLGLYWQIGEYISGKLAAADSGEGVVDRLAQPLAPSMTPARWNS
jgi:hypothetical protein